MTTYDYIAANKRRSVILMIVFFVFVLFLGWFLDRALAGGGFYLFIAAVYSIITALVSYYSGDKVALAVSGAHPVTEKDDPRLYRTIENLCITIGMKPTPKVYVIDDPAINAFATGRDPAHASIAVTSGALQKLDNEELEGVLAHEVSHIRNYDIRVLTLVIVLVGTVTILSDLVFRSMFFGGARGRDNEGEGGGVLILIGLALMVFAPIVAQLIKFAVSRRREYLADSSGALITRFPEGLARALEKIQKDDRPMARTSAATAHLFIANPLSGKSLANMFSTHPPIEKRIEALRKMSGPALT